MDLSFVEGKKVDSIKILDKMIKGVCSTNNLIGIGIDLVIGTPKREELLKVYGKLVKEEASELRDAIDDKDRVEFLDAVVDTMIVGCYYCILEVGTDYGELRIHSEDNTLEEDVEAFVGGVYENDYESLYYLACDIFFKLNIDHEKAIDTVLASNLSKFPTLKELNTAIHIYDQSGNNFTGDEVNYMVNYIESEGRYSGVHCKCVLDSGGVERKVFWATHDNGEEKLKYVKPLTFVEPDFESCFNW
ncbi:NTP pyrophosphohydrolase-like domain [Vibrio phage 1.063.O._10N.261.45.C7]|nr:NTP pyrophosphohydrolase-like domain [Vibrio phage 1.063.O._10N.261.45.C7]